MTEPTENDDVAIQEINEMLITLLQNLLSDNDYALERKGDWLIHPETGYAISPKILYIEPVSDSLTKTGTVIQIFHPTLFPELIFEYQHTPPLEDDWQQSVVEGFFQWISSDWSLLVDVTKTDSDDFMRMNINVEQDGKTIIRQLTFGNVLHFGGQNIDTLGDDAKNTKDEHDFCPCCLFTNSIESFQPFIKSDKNYALRLFAYNNGDIGEVDADCRVNGEDYDAALEELKSYAKKWNSEDIEFRKQYVVLRTVETVEK